jgi:hypothetical protein
MKINWVIILFSVAGLLQAATITNTATVAMVSETDSVISLAKFDAGLGTLTGIHIEFITALYGLDYQFDNDSSRAVTDIAITLRSDPNGYFSTDVSLAGTGISTDGSGLLITAFHSLTLQKNDNDAVGVFNIGGADYGRWAPNALTATAGGNVDSSAFADYIGTGEFTSTINSLIVIGYTDFSDVQVKSIFPTGEFSATVVYEYSDSIPEPAAIGLIGLGGFITLVTSRIARNMKQSHRTV